MNHQPVWATSALALTQYFEEARLPIERALILHLPRTSFEAGGPFNDAVRYAVFPGGKRLRAILALLAAELVGGDTSQSTGAAVAVEYLHCSSLIFDDLPCMDDARERRGHECVHLRYGEPVAILVALSLMNAAYDVIVRSGAGNPEIAVRACQKVCASIASQITGQVVDVMPAGSDRELAAVQTLRNVKTSALMHLAVTLGAILSDADARKISVLARFGDLLGEVFQTIDDMNDVREDAMLIQKGHLVTLAVERGAECAIRHAVALGSRAKQEIVTEFGSGTTVQLLCGIMDLIITSKIGALEQGARIAMNDCIGGTPRL